MKIINFPARLFMYYDGTTLIPDETIPEIDDGQPVAIYERADVGVIKKEIRVQLKGDRARNVSTKKRSR